MKIIARKNNKRQSIRRSLLIWGAVFGACLSAASGAADLSPAATNEARYVTWAVISNRWGTVPVNELKQAAQSGEASAQYFLGSAYKSGRQMEKSPPSAIQWISAAASNGLACAQVELGHQYELGRLVPQDYAKAEKLFRQAAEQGHPMAQNNLGNLYLQGRGVSQDEEEAVKWFRKSAEQGEPYGQANLGWAYESGVGVQKDRAQAEFWTRKAAEQGFAYAQFSMGRMAEREPRTGGNQAVAANYQVAAEWYRKAAEQGNSEAMMSLGDLYYYGKLERNYPEAVKWYRQAAEEGMDKAAARLGELYSENHPNFSADKKEAARWFRITAEKGDEESQYELGCLLLDEKSGLLNREEAEMWLRKAAANGYTEASIKLAALQGKSSDSVATSVSRNELEAASYRGNGEARLILGRAYEEGTGGPTNLVAAAKMYWWVANIGPEKDRAEALRRVVGLYASRRVGLDVTEAILPKSRDQFARHIESYRNLATEPETQFQIGEMFNQGTLLPHNKHNAVEWLTRAAKGGSAAAMNLLGDMWAAGVDGQPDPAESVRWYRKAATNGLGAAQSNLGRAYRDGRGVPPDLVEAAAWLQLAANQNESDAITQLASIKSQLKVEQAAAASRRAEELAATISKRDPQLRPVSQAKQQP